MEEYDCIVIGAGSAGMSAAIYAERFGLSTMVIGKVVGGLLNDSHNVENYPGFPSIPGFDLMMEFKKHVESLKIPIREEWVETLVNGDRFTITTDKAVYRAKTIIMATGAKHRHLGKPGEEQLAGKGVSYCATCDAAFFKGVPVAVVGGGDSAAQAAFLVSQHASHVYVLVRKDRMRAEPLNQKRIEESEKVDILYETEVEEFQGEKELEGIKLTKAFDGQDVLPVNGAFIEIGSEPQSELAHQLGLALNERKEIIIDSESRTSLPRVYAAGDVGNRRFKQAITGAAEGTIAAFSAYEDVQRMEEGKEVEFGY